MKLSRDQRARLFAGDYRPLVFMGKRPCIAGHEYVVVWSRPKPMADGLGNTLRPPRERLLWIEVTTVVRRAAGGWAVRFDVFDNRQPRRLLRATPPRYDETLRREDAKRKLGDDEIKAAAEQSFYTSNPRAAVDIADAPPKGWKSPDLCLLEAKQRDLLDDAQRGRLSLGRQLDSLLEDARESRVSVRARVRRIEQELEILRRDVERGKVA